VLLERHRRRTARPTSQVKAVVPQSGCWAKAGPQRRELACERTTLERWHAVHDLLGKGVGLLDCARRLDLALNTVQRYARASEPDRLRRPPQYRACQVDAHRDHLRRRRTEEPGMPVKRLLEEIHDLGYTGSLNLLCKYINQGRPEGDRIMPSPRRLISWIMTSPEHLPDKDRTHLGELLIACPEMTTLAKLVRDFASLAASTLPTSWRVAGRRFFEPSGRPESRDVVCRQVFIPVGS